MTQWEYWFVTTDEGRARWVNGVVLKDWKKYATMAEYANLLGAEGWELVAVESGGLSTYKTYYFKRPNP